MFIFFLILSSVFYLIIKIYFQNVFTNFIIYSHINFLFMIKCTENIDYKYLTIFFYPKMQKYFFWNDLYPDRVIFVVPKTVYSNR